jgi:hypothetical protein
VKAASITSGSDLGRSFSMEATCSPTGM